jgi:hypothetical protein
MTEQAAWDQRYSGPDLVWGAGPNHFVADEAAALPPGRAIDLGAGEGRNAIWLAGRGWQVTAVDFSAAGLARAARLAAERGASVDWVQQGRAPLPAPADPDAQVDHRVGLAGESLAGFGPEPGGHGVGQRPGQDRQPGLPPGQHRGGGRGLVVGMPGDPGVVEDEQAADAAAGGCRGSVGRQLGRVCSGQLAVGVVQQGHAGRAELGSGLAEFCLPGAVQVGAGLVKRGRLPVRVAQDVDRRAARHQRVDDGAQPEALVVGVRDHREHASPGRQRPAGPYWLTHGKNRVHGSPPKYP